jgi:chaperonin GroES
LPDTVKERPQEGKVIAVGPGRVSDDGTRIPMELAAGDRVIYSKYAGTEYKDGDDEYLILRDSDVLAKIS